MNMQQPQQPQQNYQPRQFIPNNQMGQQSQGGWGGFQKDHPYLSGALQYGVPGLAAAAAMMMNNQDGEGDGSMPPWLGGLLGLGMAGVGMYNGHQQKQNNQNQMYNQLAQRMPPLQQRMGQPQQQPGQPQQLQPLNGQQQYGGG